MSEVTLIIIFYLASKLCLDLLQICTVRTAVIDNDSARLLKITNVDECKSRDYNISKLKLSIVRNIIYVSWIYFLLVGGLVNHINFILVSHAFSAYAVNIGTILITYTLIYVSLLPISYYSTFVIETKFDFNTSTKKLFIKDNFISMIMTAILIIVMSSIFFFIIKYEDMWWFFMSTAIFLLTILSVYIYPTYISPIFNKFNILDNEEIKNEIKDLSNKTDFSIENLYVMDKSKRSKHPNAYFTGFKNNRRIVFYDTLIELLSPSEIKAVLAHEIGHYKHNHIIKSLFLSTAIIFIGLYLLSSLVNNENYIEFLNLPQNESAQLIALVFTYQIISFFINPIFFHMRVRYNI